MIDITDWAGMSLPEVVQLARDRWQYRQTVQDCQGSARGMTHG